MSSQFYYTLAIVTSVFSIAGQDLAAIILTVTAVCFAVYGYHLEKQGK